MEREVYIKKYGVVKLHNGRYAVVSDAIPEKKQGHTCFELNYAKLETAIKKADVFAKSLYKNFVRKIGEKEISVEFVLENIGLITL